MKIFRNLQTVFTCVGDIKSRMLCHKPEDVLSEFSV